MAHAEVDARRRHAELDDQPAVDEPGRHGDAAQLQRQKYREGRGHQRSQPRVAEHHVELFVADCGAQRRVELGPKPRRSATAGTAGRSPCACTGLRALLTARWSRRRSRRAPRCAGSRRSSATAPGARSRPAPAAAGELVRELCHCLMAVARQRTLPVAQQLQLDQAGAVLEFVVQQHRAAAQFQVGKQAWQRQLEFVRIGGAGTHGLDAAPRNLAHRCGPTPKSAPSRLRRCRVPPRGPLRFVLAGSPVADDALRNVPQAIAEPPSSDTTSACAQGR